MNRFDYVKYDETSIKKQEDFKLAIEHVENLITHTIVTSPNTARYKALALTALEEVYMWIGKGVRDEQVNRTGVTPLQEERGHS